MKAVPGFLDIHLDVQHVVTNDSSAAVRWIARATDTAGFMRRPATGKQVSVWGAEFFHVQEGQVVGNWLGADYLGLLVHLGIVASPWPAAGG